MSIDFDAAKTATKVVGWGVLLILAWAAALIGLLFLVSTKWGFLVIPAGILTLFWMTVYSDAKRDNRIRGKLFR